MKAIFTNNFYFQYRMPEFAALVDRLPKNDVVDKNFTWGTCVRLIEHHYTSMTTQIY